MITPRTKYQSLQDNYVSSEFEVEKKNALIFLELSIFEEVTAA